MAQSCTVEYALPERARVWLTTVAMPGSRLVSATWLTGGVDHGNHAVRLVDPAGHERMAVLRRWVRPEWRWQDPDYTVEREVAALSLLTAVVDWANASVGHRDQDTGHMRWNLTVSYGREVADRFRDTVVRLSGHRYDPFWDVRAIVDLIVPGRPLDLDREHGAARPTRLVDLERLLADALA
jgi:hypothetical protein